MSDLLEKCTVCQALVDEEDLFCANCGTETPHKAAGEAGATLVATHNFLCEGCGAAMSYDASAQNLRCPFCGGEKLRPVRDGKVLAPQRVAPFAITQAQALAELQKFFKASFWRPSDLGSQAVVTQLTAVLCPYWTCSARTHTYWTADTSETPFGARASWAPLAGHHRGEYSGLLVGASNALTPGETAALCPFDLRQAVPAAQFDLENSLYEPFQVQRKYARPLAKQGLEQLELEACRQYVPGQCRNLRVNIRMEGLSMEPILVPVWIMAYRYQERAFRFLVNGQTGRCTGTAPTSTAKIAYVALAVLGAMIAIGAVILVCGGIGAAVSR